MSGTDQLREHYTAVRDMVPVTGRYAVHLGAVEARVTNGYEEDVDYPYIVIWGDPGDKTGESLAGTPDTLTLRIRVTYAALGFEQLLDVIDAVRTALDDQMPVVEGRSVSRLRQASLLAAQTDFTVTLSDRSHPMYAVDEFVLTSQRA